MRYRLGKKYENPKTNRLKVVLASLFATLQVTVLLTLTFLGCLVFATVVKDYWYFNILFLIFSFLWIPFIYKKCMYTMKVTIPELYKLLCAIFFAFVVIPVAFTILAYIITNADVGVDIENYHYRGVVVTTRQVFNIIINDYIMIIGRVKITVPKIVALLVSVGSFLYIEYRILTLKFGDALFINADNKICFPNYEFTLVDDIRKLELISYEYLSRLQKDETEKIVANKMYFDVYVYGENDEKYFFIEYYITKAKQGKVVESIRKNSPVFVYNEKLFGNSFDDTIIVEEDLPELEEQRQEEPKELEEQRQEEPKELEEQKQEEQIELEEQRQEEQIELEEQRQEEQIELEEQRQEEQKELEEQRQEEQKELEEQRQEEQKELEEQRLAYEKELAEQKAIEEQRQKEQKELEEQRLAYEKELAEQKAIEEQRQKEQNVLEEQKKAAENTSRQESHDEKKRAEIDLQRAIIEQELSNFGSDFDD